MSLNLDNLILGDCIEEMKKLVQSNIKVDAIITDIPYYSVLKEDWDNLWKQKEEYLNWFDSCMKLSSDLLTEKGSLLIFSGRQNNRYIAQIMDQYFKEQRIIIWCRKRDFNSTRGKALSSEYEPICYYTKSDEFTFNMEKVKVNSNRKEYSKGGILEDGIDLSDVWKDISALPYNSPERVEHPSQKPIKLMERCVNMITNEDDIVLDFCMGSGSTGVACLLLNRNFIGIEKDENYYKLVKQRMIEIYNSNMFL